MLLHLSSLPHIGLGEDAFRFVDLLASMSMSVWQMLPVGEVDKTGSPYQSCSLHAGRGAFIDRRVPLSNPVATPDYLRFCQVNKYWLSDYTLFRAISEALELPWWRWPDELRFRDEVALEQWRENLGERCESFAIEQYRFYGQWAGLRQAANDKGIALWGDVPMYPAHDSADVWANQGLFLLDADSQPVYVAGVPPDAFSSTGQLWGNPVYNWDALRSNRFDWWCARIRTGLVLFDCLRLDHFRGFDASWYVPRASDTAAAGFWHEVPGYELLAAFKAEFPSMPFVAEDLGVITASVDRLRDEFGLPGIRVLQFALDGDENNPHLPSNLGEDCIVYTGTHDNNTSLGFYRALTEAGRERFRTLFNGSGSRHAALDLVRAALSSPARVVVVPLQDLLELDSSARMNTPGTTTGNWQWRFAWVELPGNLGARILGMLKASGRIRSPI